jgi:fluoride exporter
MNQALAIGVVAVGTGVGAITRYLTHHFVSTRLERDFPWATLLVNVVGSFILGFVVAVTARHAASETVRLIIGVGFCGGLTTFSTYSYESLDLLRRSRHGHAGLYAAVTIVAGLLAAALGLTLGA